MLDPESLLIGGITGGILSGLIPIIQWAFQSKRESDEVKEFLGFLGHERDIRVVGRKNYWWNPSIGETKKQKILIRMVQKGLLIYDPENGYRLKDYPGIDGEIIPGNLVNRNE